MDFIPTDTLHCQRCGYEWVPRSREPKMCPQCHSRKWQTPSKWKELNVKGEPQRIEIEEMRLAPDARRELPTIEELSGSDPNFTGALSTEEYIRQIRNDPETFK